MKDKIIQRIQKLMALSASTSFEAEADTALMKVRELLFKHGIDEEEFKQTQFVEKLLMDGKKYQPVWMRKLATILGLYFNVSVFINRYKSRGSGGVCYAYAAGIYGKAVNVEVFEYTFETMVSLYKRKSQLWAKETLSSGMPYYKRSKLKNDYCTGVNVSLFEKVQHLKTDLPIKKGLKEKKKGRSGTVDTAAFMQGQLDGQNVRITVGVKHDKEKGLKKLLIK